MSSRQPSSHRLTVLTRGPLHHGAFGADTGNVVLFRRVPLASDPTGRGVPAISGNAWRGRLRRLVMRDLLLRCGLSRTTTGVTAQAWDRLYAALANGGHLTGSEVTVDPSARRALRDALPALSVLGGALYTYMLPGRVSCGWLWPLCLETVASGLTTGTTTVSAEELVTEISQTRHVDRDEQNPETSGVTPMPVTLEALVPGIELQGTVIAQADLTPEEWGVIAYGLGLISSLGGKDGAGYGRVEITHTIPAEALGAYETCLSDPARLATAREALQAMMQPWAA